MMDTRGLSVDERLRAAERAGAHPPGSGWDAYIHDVRALLDDQDRLRARVCELENGGSPDAGGKGHCSVCAFVCYGRM